jgi:hypothetical protein
MLINITFLSISIKCADLGLKSGFQHRFFSCFEMELGILLAQARIKD